MATTAQELAPPDDRAASRRTPWNARLSPRTRDLLALGIVAAALLLPLRGFLRNPGPPMEEGFMLVFPERLLQGDIANRDFLHLYGPGSLWVLAPVYKLFGTSLETERLFGFLQQAGIAYAAYFVGRWWGRRVAVVCALLALAIMLPPAGLTAFAWPGAVALGLGGVAVGLHARAATDDRRAQRLAIVAGVLFGAAFLFRLDVVIAVTLALAVILWRAPRPRVIAMLASAAATASLVLVQFLTAGFENAFRGMVIDPVFNLRGGRRLPIPPAWSSYDGFLQNVGDVRPLRWPLPTLAGPHQLFLWFVAALFAAALLIGTGIWAIRRDPSSARARAVLAAGVFAFGILPQAMQRPDSTHIAWVSCVSIGLVPIALMEIFAASRRRTEPASPRPWIQRHARLLACAVPIAVMVLILPNFTVRSYADVSVQSFGIHRSSFLVERDGRRFYYGDPTVVEAAKEMIPDIEAITKPGDRIFVGPANLRRTNTSEAWIYYLFPELTPGTYYIEMDPGVANAPGSGLARDLRSSDVAVLSTIWQDWHEANDSLKSGSRAATRVLRKHFCPVGEYGTTFLLYERCR